ncbi:MAG: TerB family tellurite resistance protein [Gammaproteobacteria bacterium]|nr:TerB family tellurite resistance protein [Gammaproteobacteria bacterium]MDH3858092.1 TerB family tellurite resistance protein [Gammaproteobacteria bacterium]
MRKILLKFLTIERIETSLEDIEHALQVATAVLLVEVTRADFIVDASEKLKLRELLEQQFNLSEMELEALLEKAEDDADRMVSIQHVTRLLNEHYDHAMKLRIVEMMWQLVYADGEKDHYEEHLIRQVAELLYLSHGEFIQARHKAEVSIDR